MIWRKHCLPNTMRYFNIEDEDYEEVKGLLDIVLAGSQRHIDDKALNIVAIYGLIAC